MPVTPAIIPLPETPAREPAPSGSHAGRVTDIRSLTTLKNPGNAMEMAALVGYYLAHAAPKEERLEAFGTKELEKYFIQGGYPVPSAPRLVLFNAKKAGYFDVKSHGTYKVNAVGFNLIEHSLPGTGGSATLGKSATPRRSEARRPKRK